MRLLVAVLPVTIFTIVTCLLLRLIDRRLQSGQVVQRFPVASCAIVMVAAWTIGIVAFVGFLPGGRGPVQYAAGNPAALLVFDQRFGTILAMCVAPIILGLIGGFRLTTVRHFRAGWFLAAIISYAIAWVVLYLNAWFWPTV